MQTERKPMPVPILPPSCLTNMAINHKDVIQLTVSKLRQVADWMENRTAQQSENIARRNDEKMRGDEIRLLAYFLESKPFWEDNFHKLECFACKFLQEVKKNCNKLIQQMNWMTKRIKKENKTRIVALCPKCTSGDPWTIHGQREYTLL
jgi:hypothetical protein